MKISRFEDRMIFAPVLLLLVAAAALAEAQSAPLTRSQIPRMAPHATRSRQGVRTNDDDLAGLKYTDDQKAKIDQIHQDMKSRMDAVVKDEALNAGQKQAMLEGFARIERRQVLQVLTPDQLAEVRKKALARRAAEQQQRQQALPSAQPLPPTATPATTQTPPTEAQPPAR
jgi:Spy/CpxP family protein refolding chaperone